jgi:hypothetical protein
MAVWYIYRLRILHVARKNILLWVKKVKISLQSPKTEFRLQNQYGRVIYPSIGNFIWNKQKYNFGGQKSKTKPSKPKNGIRALRAYLTLFDPEKYIFACFIIFFRSMVSTILSLEPKLRFWALMADFHLFDPQKYIFIYSI